eukprot:2289071-Rhodomonas_salina.1
MFLEQIVRRLRGLILECAHRSAATTLTRSSHPAVASRCSAIRALSTGHRVAQHASSVLDTA